MFGRVSGLLFFVLGRWKVGIMSRRLMATAENRRRNLTPFFLIRWTRVDPLFGRLIATAQAPGESRCRKDVLRWPGVKIDVLCRLVLRASRVGKPR